MTFSGGWDKATNEHREVCNVEGNRVGKQGKKNTEKL